MNRCKKCGGKLDVTHSYAAGGTARTQRAVCKTCDIEYVATIVTTIEEAKHGAGAYAKAKAIERGDLSVTVIESPTEFESSPE
jgi:hypothetical protein